MANLTNTAQWGVILIVSFGKYFFVLLVDLYLSSIGGLYAEAGERLVQIGSGVFSLTQTNREHLKRAAPIGTGFAPFQLGLQYFIDQDYTNALEWFVLSARQGYRDAQYALSVMHSKGLGTTNDQAESEYWLRNAATPASAEAMEALGTKLVNGPSPDDIDLRRGLRLLRWAADRGQTNAATEYLSALNRLTPQQEFEAVLFGSIPGNSGVKRVVEFSKPSILEGLRGVHIFTHNPDKDAEDDGFTEERIKRTVELRLRAAGISINGGPMFVITPRCMKDGNLYYVSIQADLYADVVYRLKTVRLPIWSTVRRGIYGTRRISEVVRIVEDITDEFANQFLEANPKK